MAWQTAFVAAGVTTVHPSRLGRPHLVGCDALCSSWSMKALSIKQPLAQLIIMGAKDVENRSRRTSFLAALPSTSASSAANYEDVDTKAFPPDLREPVKLAWERNAFAGRVIGTVELDCIRDSNSIWAIDDYWHWVLRDPRPYSHSRPAKGQLGLWEWTASGTSR